MSRWLKGSFLALIALTFFKPAVVYGSTGRVKTAPAAGWLLLVPPFAQRSTRSA